MLELLVQDLDICEVGKLLGKNELRAFVTKSEIVVYSDEIADVVIDELFEHATILSAQNYHLDDATTSMDITKKAKEKGTSGDVPSQVAETTEVTVDTVTSKAVTGTNGIKKCVKTGERSGKEVLPKTREPFRSKISNSEMLCRGEVYKLGSVRNKEEGEGTIKECVIIIQNDYQTSASDDTIALFCTSHYEERAPIRFSFVLTEETMVDHSVNRLGPFDRCTMFVGHIKGISRIQLGKYLGKMTDLFMNTLQPSIDFCLGLKRSRTVNWPQLKMLSTINMADMFEISESKISQKQKVDKFLELFHFDMKKTGMEYVRKSILIASRLGDYRLEDLAQLIAKEEKIEAGEVLRLIVARIKENFNFRKSPAISFIRLLDKFLRKG